MKKIASIEINIVNRRVYIRDPEVYGTGPDNVMTIPTENAIVLRLEDGSTQTVYGRPICINLTSQGPDGVEESRSQSIV
jgi:hypothetical protein